ncbi:MAG: tRNA 5-hydroxyuridine modification protein YegQ, partial [Candidatus Thioglobus sp.]|nr:tRNA 5-hydroxyuridine modification protein YegQ [Candidatus Thioglobus sp.]MBT5286901.1 tRNA 5-hydroxyuridine modification protein YegQ [Candidatus Thioglobus sp.]MBT7411749.1 tRNA 5-hydroxyuridine modification protein YegQ [Candidatus Thioglobus sp.]
MNRPELLSPAGSLKHMRYAYAYGADAVYAGQPRYSLRVRNNSFDFDALKQGIFEAHENDKKFFVASNIIPHNAKIKTYMKDIEPVIELNPDALIMADPGLIMMVKEKFPQQVIHLSVQANTINYATVKFWKNAGISRIILSRELSLDEVKEIRQECPDIELEVFVHGALCIAYSGRCLLSGYFNHRDPNQGSCTNSCRWKYDVKEAEETIEGDIKAVEIKAPIDQVVLLEEEGRPGEQMPAYEDEHGTYIMNSKDLRAIEHVHTLTAMGIDSLKIEGRTKSHYYAARTAQVYRKAIDDAVAGKKFDPEAFGVLENLANRGYTDGFYRRHQPEELQTYFDNYSRSHQQQVVGEILDYKDGKAFIEAKNKFSVGDSIEV